MRVGRVSIKAEAAGFGGDMLGFRARVFAAVQRAEGIDAAVAFAVAVGLEERAHVRQLAAGPAMDALAPPPLRDRQHGRERPSDLGSPGVLLTIDHSRHSTDYKLTLLTALPHPSGWLKLRPRV